MLSKREMALGRSFIQVTLHRDLVEPTIVEHFGNAVHEDTELVLVQEALRGAGPWN